MDYNNLIFAAKMLKKQKLQYTKTIICIERLLTIQHLFPRQKGWKYSKTNSVSSAEKLQPSVHQKPKIPHVMNV